MVRLNHRVNQCGKVLTRKVVPLDSSFTPTYGSSKAPRDELPFLQRWADLLFSLTAESAHEYRSVCLILVERERLSSIEVSVCLGETILQILKVAMGD